MCQLALLLQQRRHEQANNKEKDDNNDSKAQDHKSEVTTEAPVTGTCNSSNLAAANVELRTFAQARVLESEVTILHFLHDSLPPQTVPVYMGHYKSTNYAAIVMEYLPGEDMNQLRETIVRGGKSRRLYVQDAVYLTADVFLPLLQRMNFRRSDSSRCETLQCRSHSAHHGKCKTKMKKKMCIANNHRQKE